MYVKGNRIDFHSIWSFSVGIILCVLIIASLFSLIDSAWAGKDTDNINDRIKSLQKEYEASKKELEEGKKRLKKKEQERLEVLKKLQKSERKIDELHRTIISIKKEEKVLDGKIKTSQDLLLDTEQDLDARSGEYAQKLRSIYKRQRLSALETLFYAGSISSMLRGMKMFTILAREDVRVMSTIRTQKQTVENLLKALSASINAKRSLASRKESEELTLEKTRKDRQALLTEIRHDEELEKELIIQRQKDMEQTQAEIEKLLREIDRQVNKRDFLKDISVDVRNYNFGAKKGKLPWPVSGIVVSSFGIITDTKTKTQINNRGIEIETNHGEPVCAVGSGIVMVTQSIRGYGNFVMIFHPPNYVTVYAHLSDILVNTGMEVREGDYIGRAGTTGLIDDSKSRLLLEVLNKKIPENPLTWLKPDSRRIKS